MAPHSFNELIALYESKANEYEDKAKEFRSMASNLRRDLATFGISDKGLVTKKPTITRLSVTWSVTPQQVRDAVKEKGGRVKHVAERLAASEESVAAIVKDPANGIRDKGRGWLEIVEPAANPRGEFEEGGE